MSRQTREVFVAGTGVTAFGKFLDRGLRSLAEEAVSDALLDAGTDAERVEVAYFANACAGLITGQEMIRGQVALRRTGLLGIPVVNVENACASGATAFHLAWAAVAHGAADVALAVGAEKMSHPDKARSFAAFNGGVDLESPPDQDERDARSGSLFMDLYAGVTRRYMELSGATVEDFAAIAVKSHANAAHNPKSQYREPLTSEEVLASRAVADPLTLLMCSPIGDGAAALVLCSKAGLRDLGAKPVRALASVVLSARDGDVGQDVVVSRAARSAYAEAGIAADDVDVIELHDAAAPAELFVAEELGIAPPNRASELLRAGAFALGGRIPLNPSGGLLSKGHPIGATGCAQIVEIADQLRDRCGGLQVKGASVGLAENGGGWLDAGPAVGAVTILGRA